VLKTSGYTKAGTLIVTNATTTQLITTTSRDYLGHTASGTSGSGSVSWTFNWRAPSTYIDSVIFYSAINASNNNGSSSGDMILSKNFTYKISTLLPTAVISVSDSTVCIDDTVFLYGSGANNPHTWTWSMPGGIPSASSKQDTFVINENSENLCECKANR
jgi:hypothetical protein